MLAVWLQSWCLHQHTASCGRWSLSDRKNLFIMCYWYCGLWRLTGLLWHEDCSLAFKKIFPKFSSQITQPLSLSMHELLNKSRTKKMQDAMYMMPSNICCYIQSTRELTNSWLPDSLKQLFIFALRVKVLWKYDFQDCIAFGAVIKWATISLKFL